eukprot:TRINITY_DN1607_c0_g1_i1.p1 TRINITY_DN1607_c0_g1~~TRINITY_DN1607_c0_g1_i1.p1  ORF type:complete len:208 (+),score=54.61 TRINITY_DN1607_c0_g1_i1:147-770(+)
MSLQWQFVFVVLMLELAACFILCIPWPQSIQSALVKAVGLSSNVRTLISVLQWTFGIVLVLFLDAARQVYFKTGASNLSASESKHDHRSFDSRLYEQSSLFRAERNLYLGGFVLVLGLVLNRLYTLMKEVATARVNVDVLERQSKQAAAAMSDPALLKVMAEAAEKKEAAGKKQDEDPKDEVHEELADLSELPSVPDTGIRQRKKAD